MNLTKEKEKSLVDLERFYRKPSGEEVKIDNLSTFSENKLGSLIKGVPVFITGISGLVFSIRKVDQEIYDKDNKYLYTAVFCIISAHPKSGEVKEVLYRPEKSKTARLLSIKSFEDRDEIKLIVVGAGNYHLRLYHSSEATPNLSVPEYFKKKRFCINTDRL